MGRNEAEKTVIFPVCNDVRKLVQYGLKFAILETQFSNGFTVGQSNSYREYFFSFTVFLRDFVELSSSIYKDLPSKCSLEENWNPLKRNKKHQ
jgi:hypothetical protein